jgi:hypothetical protein
MAKAPKRKKRKASKAKVRRGVWTPELVETLRGLWPSGLPCAEIAGKIGHGFTREACTSKAWKLGLGPHPAGRGAKKRPAVPSTLEAALPKETLPKAALPKTEAPLPKKAAGGYERQKRWRERHPEAYRDRQREYMRSRYRAGKPANLESEAAA